jgi:hypothetical protein
MHIKHIFFFLFIPLLLACTSVFCQSLDTSWWVPATTTYAVAADSQYTYVSVNNSSQPTLVGPYTGYAVKLSQTSVQPQANFPNFNNQVTCVAPDGLGGWYAGGAFTRVNGEERDGLVHILPNGSIDPEFTTNIRQSGGYGAVSELIVTPQHLFIRGFFNSVNNEYRYGGLAKLHRQSGKVDTAFAPKYIDIPVRTFLLHDVHLYIASYFSVVDNINRLYLARLNASTGRLDTTWKPACNGAITKLQATDTHLFVFGSFTSIGGAAKNKLAKLDISTGLADITWTSGAGPSINDIAIDTSFLYVGESDALLRLSTATGAKDISFNVSVQNPGYNTYVGSVQLYGAHVYINGAISLVQGKPFISLARIVKQTGQVDEGWNPAFSNTQQISLGFQDGDIAIGFTSNTMGGFYVKNLIRFHNLTGQVDSSFKPNPSGIISDMVTKDGFLYLGGSFSLPYDNNKFIASLARINTANGLLDSSWNPKLIGSVRRLVIHDSLLYACGDYTSINNKPFKHISRVSLATALPDSTWDPKMTGQFVSDVAITDSFVYVAGKFTNIGPVFKRQLAKLRVSNAELDTLWHPQPSDQVNAVLVLDTMIYAGGWYQVIGGIQQRSLALLNNTDGKPISTFVPPYINSSLGQNITHLVAHGPYLYYNTGPQGITRINRFSGQADASFSPSASYITGLKLLNGALFSTGGSSQPNMFQRGWGSLARMPMPDISHFVYTVKTGNWHDASVWNTGQVPTANSEVMLLHSLTIQQNVTCRRLELLPGTAVQIASGVQMLVQH